MSSETSFISMSSTVLQVQASSSGNLILVPAMKQRHFTAGVACSSDVRVGETVLVCETQRHSLGWKSYRMKDNGFLWQDTRPPEMSLILYSFFASVNSLPAGIVARGSFFFPFVNQQLELASDQSVRDWGFDCSRGLSISVSFLFAWQSTLHLPSCSFSSDFFRTV